MERNLRVKNLNIFRIKEIGDRRCYIFTGFDNKGKFKQLKKKLLQHCAVIEICTIIIR